MIVFHRWYLWYIYIIGGCVNIANSQVSPKLAPLPRELEFKRGERFQLVCSCREGDPPLSFNWVRNAQPLVENIEVVVRRFDEFSSSITISALREDHAGNYTCIVSNLGGTDSSTVNLRVLVPPTWLRQPYDMSVLSGSRVTLNCETAGTPKPTVTWRRNRGFNVQQMEPLTATHWRTGEDGSLTTSSVRKEDEGFYSCEAANGVGEGLRKTIRIEVQVPPTVWSSEVIQTVKKGDSAVLQCHVTGDNPLTITWTKANMQFPLDSEDRIRIEEDNSYENTTSTVFFKKTAAEDTGLYFCAARNTYGQQQTAIRLRIVERPSVPKDFQVVEAWCRSIRLKWKPSYNGNSPLKNYIIRYNKKNSTSKSTEMKVSDSQSSVVVQDLRPHTTYVFRILAVNDVGTSKPSPEVAMTTREEEPEAAPTNVYVKSKDSTGFLVSWKPPPKEKWNGILLGFCIGYKKVSHGSAEASPFTYKVVPLAAPNVSLTDAREIYVGGLQEGSSYTAVVTAFNKAGIGPPSEQVLVKTSYGESPQVPTVKVVSTQQTVVKLKVSPSGRRTALPQYYVLHIREGSGHWSKIPLIPNNEDYSVGGLNPGSQYKLYVMAKNKYGDSGPTEILSFRTEPESSSSSMFQYEEEDIAIPFFQRLSFIIPVAVSMTTILVVPIAACCCLRKLSSLPTRRTEGVESRGFTYTPASPAGCSAHTSRTLPPRPPTDEAEQQHYSTLQNYGSVIPPTDPRFSQLMQSTQIRVSMPPLK